MAGNVNSWVMASAPAAVARSPFQFDIVSDTQYGIATDTQKRDVSEMLDLLALADTPFINKVGWGPESGGTCIEWMYEDLGPGKLATLSDMATDDVSIRIGSVDGIQISDLAQQLHEGTILYGYVATATAHLMGVITSEPTCNGSIVVSWLALDTYVSVAETSIAAGAVFYVLGNVQNEGSRPGQAKPRSRAMASNMFTILRQDVAITGTMKATDMYVIGAEDQHQILMRMKEMQRERERLALYSIYMAKTSVAAGMMNGVFGFLTTQTGDNIDRSTTALTATAVNTLVTKIWENGGRNLTVFGNIRQTAKFTQWDVNRIRTSVNESRGGGYITSYMTESGIVLDLVPMGNCPNNLMFVLDTSKIKLRAKKNRKAIMEKLGKMGDFDDYQIISEFSMEMKGFNLRQHGMFTCLK